MIRNLYLLLLAAFFTAQCVGQTSFQRSYSNFNGAKSVQQTSDGGYVLAGYTTHLGTDDMCMLKVDDAGNVEWMKSYGNGSGSERGNKAIETLDGGFLLVGKYNTGSDYQYVVKTDAFGAVEWKNHYDLGGQLEIAKDVWQLTDSSYIIVGSGTATYEFGTRLRIDKNGGIISGNRERENFSTASLQINRIRPVSGGWLAVGFIWINTVAANHDFLVMKYNSSFGKVWNRQFGDAWKNGYDCIETIDGNYVVVGTSDSEDKLLISKLSTGGTTLWSRELEATVGSGNDIAYSIAETTSGDLVITGNSSSQGMIVIKTNQVGFVLQAIRITTGSGYCINPTSDGGFVVTGDNRLVKIFEDLDASCGVTPISVSQSSVSVLSNAPSISIYNGISTSNIAFLEAPVLFTQNDICDSIGCTLTSNANVTSNYNGADISCNGAADGEGTANPIGGDSPYSYDWSSGGSTATETGLGAGTYTVTITDNNNCTATATVTLNDPPSLTASSTISSNYNGADVSCNSGSDGEATATGGGGTGSYTYAWSNSQNTQTSTGLSAGTYTVTITDANGCTETSSVTVNDPPALTASSSVSSNYNGADVSCNGDSDGEATATGSGGTGSYTYAWSNSQNTQTTTGLSAGTYTVTITDANGCTETSIVTVNDPPALTGTSTSNNATCGNSDGDATATGAGGTGSYSYLWDANANNQNTQTATGLAAGNYDVTITDDNGCTAVVSATVSNTNGPSASIASQTDIDCFGDCDGEATATQTGGTSPFTYAWSSGGNTDTETGLCAGTYTITITDANNCDGTTTVTITEPSLLIGTIATGEDFGNCDGTATAAPAGGTSPYTYQWDDTNTQATQQATGLCSGTYCVTVTDANGCTWDTCGVNVMVGIYLPNMQGASVQVYPNPNNGMFTLELEGLRGKAYVIITDALSREIASLPLAKTRAEIDLRKQGSGVYFVTIETENGTLVRKVIVE